MHYNDRYLSASQLHVTCPLIFSMNETSSLDHILDRFLFAHVQLHVLHTRTFFFSQYEDFLFFHYDSLLKSA